MLRSIYLNTVKGQTRLFFLLKLLLRVGQLIHWSTKLSKFGSANVTFHFYNWLLGLVLLFNGVTLNFLKTPLLASLFILASCATTPSSNHQTPQPSHTESEQALIRSEAWLANNLTKQGVVQTSSGLQYKIIKPSDGCSIDASQPVTVHYESRLPETGLLYDSSYNRGSPSIFPLDRVILGWTEGVASMKVGEIRELYVHPKLAYGERGSLPIIKPNVVSQYKVQLLDATCI